jgi:hypothetical protein
MATGESRPLAQHLERLWNSGTVSGLSDAELVRRFTGSKGPAAEQAFEALLGRHGPMVLGVCRHILRRPQDVDDAFQATSLVLVRKARSILRDGEKPRAILSTSYITVQQGDQIFVFPFKQAKWSKGIRTKPLDFRQTAQGNAGAVMP